VRSAPRSKAYSPALKISSYSYSYRSLLFSKVGPKANRVDAGQTSVAVSFFAFRFAFVAKLPSTRGSYLLFVIACRPL
jgi:hypothetical protein